MAFENDKKYGREIENRFRLYAEKMGYKVYDSTSKQDRIEHYDFKIVNSTGKSLKIEVKGQKRVNKGEELSNDYTWVEFKGISGYSGWVYGKSDYIAFERGGGVYTLVNRVQLIDVVTKEVFMNDCEFIHKGENEKLIPQDALYKLYRRENDGRSDLMTLIPTSLLDQIGRKL